jgi:cardiolipin synthase
VNVPNTLTVMRIASVPVFVALFLTGQMKAALGVFIFAGVTDVLDGIAARALKQFTKLGAALDPLADKLLGLSAMGLLCWSHRLPFWLLWLLVFREACILTAIWILTSTGRSYVVRPTRFGKYSTFFIAATTFFALVQGARDVGTTPALVALALITGELIIVSWAQYLVLFIDLMGRPPQEASAKVS